MSNNPSSPSDSSAGRGDAPLWLTALAKSGYAARGFVYLVIGTLALLQAFGSGGNTTDSKGAIEALLSAPAGVALIWAIAVGLVGYSVWRAIQSILDVDGHGTDGKGLVIRAALLISAVTHTLLAFYAASVAIGSGGDSGGGGGGGNAGLVATLLGWPGGKWIAIFVGLCFIGAGIAHAVKAHKEKYEKRFVIDPATMEKLEPICKFGLYARSVVFVLIGGMFAYAAWTQNPDQAEGIAGVLDTLQAFGNILMGIIAAGLFAFGLYSIFEAIYRKIDKPDSLDPTEEG